ncbi:MAG: BMP family ABC transporter substrate-binding protein [Chloroflexota bacterium]
MKRLLIAMLVLLLMTASAVAQDDTEANPFTFGIILVGSQNDQGWSQAHVEGAQFAAERYGATLLIHENYNAATAEEQSMAEIVEGFVDAGAELIILSSDEFQDEGQAVALLHPDVSFLHIAGDGVLTNTAPDNVGNLMPQMEWAKFLAGCSAILMSEDNHVGYLGPLINSETRRLAASAYLGARHCAEEYKGIDPSEIEFVVEWVGFWFFIEGLTEDPAQLTRGMYATGVDVVISGIDTPEAIQVAKELNELGQEVYATAYNSRAACIDAGNVCIGTASFNWGPTYLDLIEQVDSDTWTRSWEWVQPSSLYGLQGIVGYFPGVALSQQERVDLESFRLELNEYNNNSLLPGGLPLWQGPMELQDGSLLAENNELVNLIDIWYLPQLLAGMEGDSFPSDDNG